jgi:hypothetical protein
LQASESPYGFSQEIGSVAGTLEIVELAAKCIYNAVKNAKKGRKKRKIGFSLLAIEIPDP